MLQTQAWRHQSEVERAVDLKPYICDSDMLCDAEQAAPADKFSINSLILEVPTPGRSVHPAPIHKVSSTDCAGAKDTQWPPRSGGGARERRKVSLLRVQLQRTSLLSPALQAAASNQRREHSPPPPKDHESLRRAYCV
ncbi:hypothetical protein AAY473_037798 [Plecturocebus cupreus]